jgi:hypothetical protein
MGLKIHLPFQGERTGHEIHPLFGIKTQTATMGQRGAWASVSACHNDTTKNPK